MDSFSTLKVDWVHSSIKVTDRRGVVALLSLSSVVAFGQSPTIIRTKYDYKMPGFLEIRLKAQIVVSYCA